MKCLIMGAGYATRLFPLTKDKPKPLLPVGGVPIIERILEDIHKVKELDEVYVVTNEKFHTHFEKWRDKYEEEKDGIPITIINDGTLADGSKLGPLGDINCVVKRANVEDDLMIIAGDNLCDIKLKEFVEFYNEKKASVLALYDVKDVEKAKLYGIVGIDKNNKVIDFVEKPETPKSTLAATFLYIINKYDLQMLSPFIKTDERYVGDINAGDFIKHLMESDRPVYGYVYEGSWYDIGDHDELKEADEAYSKK